MEKVLEGKEEVEFKWMLSNLRVDLEWSETEESERDMVGATGSAAAPGLLYGPETGHQRPDFSTNSPSMRQLWDEDERSCGGCFYGLYSIPTVFSKV